MRGGRKKANGQPRALPWFSKSEARGRKKKSAGCQGGVTPRNHSRTPAPHETASLRAHRDFITASAGGFHNRRWYVLEASVEGASDSIRLFPFNIHSVFHSQPLYGFALPPLTLCALSFAIQHLEGSYSEREVLERLDNVSSCVGGNDIPGASCEGGVWYINASDLIAYFNSTTNPMISTPISFGGGDITVPEIVLENTFAARPPSSSTGAMIYSTTNCLEVDTLSINLAPVELAQLYLKRKKITLIASTCDSKPAIHFQGAGPGLSCQRLRSSSEIEGGALQVDFYISRIKCHVWWIVFASILCPIVIAFVGFLLYIGFGPGSRTNATGHGRMSPGTTPRFSPRISTSTRR